MCWVFLNGVPGDVGTHYSISLTQSLLRAFCLMDHFVRSYLRPGGAFVEIIMRADSWFLLIYSVFFPPLLRDSASQSYLLKMIYLDCRANTGGMQKYQRSTVMMQYLRIFLCLCQTSHVSYMFSKVSFKELNESPTSLSNLILKLV